MKYGFIKKESGAATLIITTILLVSMSLITLFAAGYSLSQQKISSNLNRNVQAFEAAEAGLEYGINYLNQNSATILANPSNGYIASYSDSNTTNVSLPNGSKFSITYTNPVQNNYTLIRIQSTGTSDDSTATKTVSQRVKFGSLLYVIPTLPLTTKRNVTLSSSAQVFNTQGNYTIQSGLLTLLLNSSQTLLSTGVSSTSLSRGSDIQQIVSSISSMSNSDFFAKYFGLSQTAAQAKANYTFSNLSSYDTSVNGLQGATIWIDQSSGTANIAGSTQVGTTTSPVLLFINGPLSLSGSAVINGLVVILSTSGSTIANTAQIRGGIISFGDVSLTNNTILTYDNALLVKLQKVTNQYYAKVPGTWRDF